jgi:hypothetical protein
MYHIIPSGWPDFAAGRSRSWNAAADIAVECKPIRTTKTVDRPLQGGGILVVPSDMPRNILLGLPGIVDTHFLRTAGNPRIQPRSEITIHLL